MLLSTEVFLLPALEWHVFYAVRTPRASLEGGLTPCTVAVLKPLSELIARAWAPARSAAGVLFQRDVILLPALITKATRSPVGRTASDGGGAALGVSVARGRIGPNGTKTPPPPNKRATLGLTEAGAETQQWRGF